MVPTLGILQLVDDGVQANLNAFLLRQLGGLALGADVEADDDGVGSGGEKDVALSDGTDAGVDDLDAHLLSGHAGERIGQNFDGTGDVALDDEGQVFDAGLANLLGKAFERDARAFGELGVALLHLAVLRDALGLVAVGYNEEGVAGVGHGFEAEDFDGCGWAGFFDGAAAVVEHGANFAEGVADDIAVVEAKGSVLNEDGGHCAAAAIELGLDDAADGLAAWGCLGRADVGDEADHFKQQVEVDSLFGGDFNEDGALVAGAGPFFRDEASVGKLLLDALGVGFRLVDLVDGHDDGDVGGLGVVNGLKGLGHDAVVGGDHDDHDVSDLCAAGSHAGEGLMAGGIEKDDLAAGCR
jgi:hypothetical protein